MSDIEKTISLKGLDTLVGDFNKLQNELDQLKGKYKSLSQQTKKDTEDHLGDLKSMAAGYLSIAALYGQLTSAATEYLALQQRISTEFERQNTSQTQTLFLAGQLSQGKNVDAFIKSDRSWDVKKAQAAIGGAMEGGTGLSYGEQETIAKEVMAASHLMDDKSVGTLAQLGGRFRKAGIDIDSGDAAIVATQLTGKEASQMGSRKALNSLQGLREAGFGQSRALAMVTAAVDADLGPKYMDKYLDALSSTDKVDFNTDRNKARFLRIPASDMLARDELMRSDEAVRKAVLGEKGNNEFNRTFGRVDDFERAYLNREDAGQRATSSAMQSDSAADAIGAAKKAGRKSQAERRAATAIDPYGDAIDAVTDAVDAEYSTKGFGSAVTYRVERGIRKMRGYNFQRRGASPAEYAEQEVGQMRQQGYSDDTIRDLIETLRDNGLATERLLNQDKAATVPSRSVHGE